MEHDIDIGKELASFMALLILAFAILALTVAWRAGSFDRPLSSVGLNVQECAKLFDVTYCGDELDRTRDQIRREVRRVTSPLQRRWPH